jgi:hypothetical protein
MTIGRVISQRVPVCPGRDSRHTVKRNFDRPDHPWWVYYEHPGEDPIPADDPHQDLVALVNSLKEQEGVQAGGSFSINEHGQVIARMGAPAGYQTNSIHVIGVAQGRVFTYTALLRFRLRGRVLDPSAAVTEGSQWPGPLCGMSYTLAAPGNTILGVPDEVWTEVLGQKVQLSKETGISPYPPRGGSLADFLASLRRQLPSGGRFRVNEHGRAFTSDAATSIGVVPLSTWFRALTARS